MSLEIGQPFRWPIVIRRAELGQQNQSGGLWKHLHVPEASRRQQRLRTMISPRSVAYGERALHLLKQLRAPAKPRNYELFYCFTQAVSKEFCEALRHAIQRTPV